jgi:hypothetical protein
MNKTLIILSLALLVLVTGCTGLISSQASTQLTDSEVEDVLDDFELSLLEETDDIELGSMI